MMHRQSANDYHALVCLNPQAAPHIDDGVV